MMATATMNGTAAVKVKAGASRVKAGEKAIVIPGMKVEHVTLRLVGDSPLLCHAWSEKAKAMMLGKQMGEAAQKKEFKNPDQDCIDSLYWLSEKPTEPDIDALKTGRFGFPTVAFKAAAVDACSFVENVTKVFARGAFHIIGEYAEIVGIPEKHEAMVRVGMGTADIRFRGIFQKWETTLNIRYNVNALSAEQIVHLFNTAGFAVGVGEHRPARDGSLGMFHVG